MSAEADAAAEREAYVRGARDALVLLRKTVEGGVGAITGLRWQSKWDQLYHLIERGEWPKREDSGPPEEAAK